MKTRFNWKDFIKKVAAIAVPVALQNLLTTTGSMVDTMMIAPLGETSVGAVGLCAQFSSLMFSCYWGFVGGGMLFFSQYWGNRDGDGINRSYGMTLAFMSVVAITFMILATCFPHLIMQLYTDKESIQEIGIKYLRVVGFAYPLQILAMAMSALLRSTERVRIPLYGAVASVATNILLNYLLIFGHLGFPAMGIQGAALATACAAGVNVLVIVIAAHLQKHPFLLAVNCHFHWNGPALKEYLRKCFPIICNELLIGIGMMVINMVLGRQSEQAIAATAVFRTLEGFVIGFFSGFSNAASVLVGKEVGAGHLDDAYDRAVRLVYMCGGCILVCCLFLLAVHGPLLRMMSLSGESFEDCVGHVGDILCGGRYPHVQLDAERHVPFGGRRGLRHDTGDHVHVSDGAAVRMPQRFGIQGAVHAGIRVLLHRRAYTTCAYAEAYVLGQVGKAGYARGPCGTARLPRKA